MTLNLIFITTTYEHDTITSIDGYQHRQHTPYFDLPQCVNPLSFLNRASDVHIHPYVPLGNDALKLFQNQHMKCNQNGTCTMVHWHLLICRSDTDERFDIQNYTITYPDTEFDAESESATDNPSSSKLLTLHGLEHKKNYTVRPPDSTFQLFDFWILYAFHGWDIMSHEWTKSRNLLKIKNRVKTRTYDY